jgi:hypothetical protein
MGFRKNFIITRVGGTAGHYDDSGTWIPGTATVNITIKASVQPLNSNDRAELTAGGERTADIVKVYTNTKLLTAKQAYGNVLAVEADILNYDGGTWKIIMCSPYQSNVISHYKAYAQEVTDGN